MNDDMGNIWEELGAEFDATPAGVPPQLPPASGGQNRHTVMDRLHRTLFNGFAFLAVFLLLIAGLEASLNPDAALTALLPGVLLVLSVAPLAAEPQRRWYYYVFLALGFTGAGYLNLAATDMALRVSLSTETPKTAELVLLFQKHLESFLTIQVWILAPVLGLGWSLLIKQFRTKYPWVDVPRRGALPRLLAYFVTLSPALVLAGCFGWYQLQQSAPSQQWRQEMAERYQKGSRYPGYRHDKSWSELKEDLEPFKLPLPSQTLAYFETRTLKLLVKSKSKTSRSYHFEVVTDTLLKSPERLQNPVSLFLARLEADAIAQYSEREPLLKLQELLAAKKLTEAELRQLLDAVLAYRKLRVDSVQRMDQATWRLIHDSFLTGFGYKNQAKALTLFGYEVPWSPSYVYEKHVTLPYAEAWYSQRSQLRVMPPLQIEAKLKSQIELKEKRLSTKTPELRLLYSLYSTQKHSQVEQLERTAVLLATRIHQAQTGSFPDSWESIQESLGFLPETAQFEFREDGEQLVLLVDGEPGYRLR